MTAQITEQLIQEKIAGLSVPTHLDGKNTLGPITALLDRLDHPELKYPSVHVGGTSGKGSTSTFIANILGQAGYKVGLFTKPHLSSVRERFVVNGEPITPADMIDFLGRIPNHTPIQPTWFELMTALAFQYFYEQRVDLAVIEVGLGGTYDATNVIQPEVSVLTNIGLDHTEILGDTIEKIALDKAGIIKPGSRVVSGVTQPSAIDIIEQRCAEQGVQLRLLGREFRIGEAVVEPEGSCFDLSWEGQSTAGLSIAMLGRHQVINAGLAAAAAITLGETGYDIPTNAIRDGLASTWIAGRMEIVARDPLIILDGAHSPPKMEAFSEGLHIVSGGRTRRIGVLAFSKGHDAEATLAKLAPQLSEAVITTFNATTDYGDKRAQDVDQVAASLKRLNPSARVHLQPDPSLALELARRLARPEDVICVTGSIFLVGQVRREMGL